MSNLSHRQSLIQEKRKNTPWRKFVMDICSWKSLMFYKNSGIISLYPETPRSPKIISFKLYTSDIEVIKSDFTGNFYKDIVNLIAIVGLPNVAQMNTENSDFSDTNIGSKSIYLSNTTINGCENVLYSMSVKDHSVNIFDSMMIWDCNENIYNSKAVIKSFNVFYCNDIVGSNNIWFSSNLNGCSECINCENLQNQSYCIKNKQYGKEEYMILKCNILGDKKHFMQNSIEGLNLACNNIIGKSNIECKDLENAYFSYNTKTGRNLFLHGSAKGSEFAYDCFTGGSPYASHMYGVMGAGACEHVYDSIFVNSGSSNIYYCMNLESCSFCLGCIGLKNKSYCILNKQYTKEERYEKVDEIFGQMEKEGTLGDFFPATMNPFYFNDTAAYLIDPTFTKEEVTAAGYLRRDDPIKVDIPEGSLIVKTSELGRFEGWRGSPHPSPLPEGEGGGSGDHSVSTREGGGSGDHSVSTREERYIDPEILKYIIQDEQGNVYRIVKMEYDFLMKYGLPLPRKHWFDRMKENFRIG